MASTEVATATEDGRLARSARTRLAIVDALRSLHHEGDLRPTANRVAERAGVSLRTVWQHFDDLETLLVEAGRRDYEIARTYVSSIDTAAPLAVRLAQLVEQRAHMYEALAPVWRAARLQEPFSPQIRRNRDQLLELGRQQLERVLAPELDAVPAGRREATLSALQVATTWATWESLRADFGLDPPAAEQAVLTLLSNLFPSV
jgi:AcrR family transcriptional regulator